jgi:Flp pilus assembly protein TadG
MMPNRYAHKARRRSSSEKGQIAVEFSLILPFFLGVVFIIFSLVMMMALGQMTFYGTFRAARSASVNHAQYQQAAHEAMPGMTVSRNYNAGRVTARGEYQMMPFLGNSFLLRSNVTLHRWPSSSESEGDNPIP